MERDFSVRAASGVGFLGTPGRVVEGRASGADDEDHDDASRPSAAVGGGGCLKDSSVRPGAWRAARITLWISVACMLVGPHILHTMFENTHSIGWSPPAESESVVADNFVDHAFPERMKGAIMVAIEAVGDTPSVLTDSVARFQRSLRDRALADPRVEAFKPIVFGVYLDMFGVNAPESLMRKALVSSDERMTILLIQPTSMRGSWSDAKSFMRETCILPPPGYTLHITGMPAIFGGGGCCAGNAGDVNVNTRDMSFEGLFKAEMLAMPIAMLVIGYIVKRPRLLILPMLALILGLIVGAALLIPLMDKVTVPTDAPAAMISVVMAASLDYGLFTLARYSEHKAEGFPLQQNIDTILRSTGRTILVSGTLIAISFFGVLILPEENLRGTGVGLGMATIGCMVASGLFLPAALLVFSKWFDRGVYLTSSRMAKVVTRLQRLVAHFGLTHGADRLATDETQADDEEIVSPQLGSFTSVTRLVEHSPRKAVLLVLIAAAPFLLYAPTLNVTGDRFAILPLGMTATCALRRIELYFPVGVLDPFAIVISAPMQVDHDILQNELRIGVDMLTKSTSVQAEAASLGVPFEEVANIMKGVMGLAATKGLEPEKVDSILRGIRVDHVLRVATRAGVAAAEQKARGVKDQDALRIALRVAHEVSNGSVNEIRDALLAVQDSMLNGDVDEMRSVGKAAVASLPESQIMVDQAIEHMKDAALTDPNLQLQYNAWAVKAEALRMGLGKNVANDLSKAVREGPARIAALDPTVVAAARAGSALVSPAIAAAPALASTAPVEATAAAALAAAQKGSRQMVKVVSDKVTDITQDISTQTVSKVEQAASEAARGISVPSIPVAWWLPSVQDIKTRRRLQIVPNVLQNLPGLASAVTNSAKLSAEGALGSLQSHGETLTSVEAWAANRSQGLIAQKASDDIAAFKQIGGKTSSEILTALQVDVSHAENPPAAPTLTQAGWALASEQNAINTLGKAVASTGKKSSEMLTALQNDVSDAVKGHIAPTLPQAGSVLAGGQNAIDTVGKAVASAGKRSSELLTALEADVSGAVKGQVAPTVPQAGSVLAIGQNAINALGNAVASTGVIVPSSPNSVEAPHEAATKEDDAALLKAFRAIQKLDLTPAQIAKVMRSASENDALRSIRRTDMQDLKHQMMAEAKAQGLSPHAASVIFQAIDTVGEEGASLVDKVAKEHGQSLAEAGDLGKMLEEAPPSVMPMVTNLLDFAVKLSDASHGMLLLPSGYNAMSDLGATIMNCGQVASMLSPSYIYNREVTWVEAVASSTKRSLRHVYAPILRSHVNGNAALFEVHTVFPSIGAGSTEWVTIVRQALNEWEAKHPGYKAYLAGGASIVKDIRANVLTAMWTYLAVTITLVMIIVYFSFRSLILPIRLTVALLFTLAVTFGIAVIVYQTPLLHGVFPYLKPFNGITYEVVPAATGVAIALGLDYDVFLISRIVEFRVAGCSDRLSVMRGLARTSGVISGAGIIMALALSGLCFADKLLLQQFGMILVTSVLVDAFVVRTILVPAFMLLAKDWNWWPRYMPPAIRYVEDEQANRAEDDVEQRYLEGQKEPSEELECAE